MANRAQIEITANDRTQSAFRSVQSGLSGLQNSAGLLTRALPALGAAFTTVGFAGFVKSSIDAADELGKLSQRVGVSVESLSALKYAGDLSDVSLDTLGNSIKKLSVNMLDTAKGTGEARDAFGALGINVRNSSGNLKTADAVLAEVADKFQGLEDGAGKTALAVKIFGRAGADLIPLLNQGSIGLSSMRDEAARLGLIMTDDLAKGAEEFNDNLTRLKASSAAAGISLARNLLPSLNETASAMQRLAAEGNTLQALLRGFAGLGKLPFDLAIAPPDFSVNGQIKDLRSELDKLQSYQRGERGRLTLDGLLPTGPELQKRIDTIKTQIDGLEKYKDKLRPADVNKSEKAQAPVLQDEAEVRSAKSTAEKIARERQRIFDQNRRQEQENSRVEFDIDFSVIEAEDDAFRKQRDRVANLRKEFIDLIDPVEKYRVKLNEIDEAERAGALSADQANEARFKINDAIDAAAGFNEVLKDQDSLARDLGLTFSSAFEDAVTGGKSLRDVISSLGQDLAKLLIRKNLTEPLLEAAQAAFDFKSISSSSGGSGGGGLLGGIIGSIGSFFGGGGGGSFDSSSAGFFEIFGKGGVKPGAAGLSAYSGSVVSSPTVFPFANGIGLMGEDGDEAILPLKRGSDGKLGVRLQGGSGGMQITNVYQIDARGAAPGVSDEIRRALRETENRAVSRATNEVQDLNRRGQLRVS